MINNLPIEIISDILVRLPVKPLLRLKTVCKSWLALITAAGFADLHHRHHSPSPDRLLIISDGSYNLHTIDIDSPDSSAAFAFAVKLHLPIQLRFMKISITGSCNGILCLREYITSNNASFLVLNPCTKEYKVVGDGGRSYISSVGLGYDSGENEYKVVQLSSHDWSWNSWKTRIYSLKTNSWRFIEDDNGFNNPNFESRICPALIRNHLLHWIFSPVPTGHISDKIGCFDVCDERWNSVALPTFADNDEKRRLISLVVLDECLCLLTNYPETWFDDDGYDLWMMKEYGVAESWVKLLNISDFPDTFFVMCKPVALSKDGRELLLDKQHRLMGMGTERSDMVLQNVSSKTTRSLDWSLNHESHIVFSPSLAKLSTN